MRDATHAVAPLRAEGLVPPAVLRRVVDRQAFREGLAAYVAMDDDDLYRSTQICLQNLDRLDQHDLGPDAELACVLIPECWERLRPGTRDRLRRISSSLAEYEGRPSRLLSAERRAQLCAAADRLRTRVACAAALDARALVEQVRFAVAGSRRATQWPPEYPVYGPAFTYRLVPALAWRVQVGRPADPAGREDRGEGNRGA